MAYDLFSCTKPKYFLFLKYFFALRVDPIKKIVRLKIVDNIRRFLINLKEFDILWIEEVVNFFPS